MSEPLGRGPCKCRLLGWDFHKILLNAEPRVLRKQPILGVDNSPRRLLLTVN